MTSLCSTCTHFMLVKIEFIGGLDSNKGACLVKPDIFDDLKVGHYCDKRGVNYNAPNVVLCTHHNKKEEK